MHRRFLVLKYIKDLKRYFYRPQTKLRECNVFTHVCLSMGVYPSMDLGRGCGQGVCGQEVQSSTRTATEAGGACVKIRLECMFLYNEPHLFPTPCIGYRKVLT